MTLQAKLTVGSVLVATVMVAMVSIGGLGSLMQFQYQSTLDRAELMKTAATEAVKDALNRPRTASLDEALRDQALIDRFNKLIGEGKTISEIAIVSNQKPPTIIRSTVRDHDGTTAVDYPEYRRLVARKNWWEMFGLLNNPKVRRYFKIDEDLGSEGKVLFKVRLIIDPAFLRDALIPTLTKNAWLAALAVGGVVLLTSLLSAVAFRTIGQIVRMLDQFERGEFKQELPPPAKGAGELSVIASKVNLLGERLRNVDRLLQDLEDAVFVFNRQMRLVFASGSVHRFLGRDRADLPGQQMQDVFPPGTALGLLISHAAQIGHPIRNRRVAIHTDGEERVGPAAVMLSVDILPDDRGGAGGGVLVRLRDPEAQRQIGRELETAGRLAAISQVSSGVAHEVKNPLNAILLHVEVAKAKLSAGDTDVAQQMEIISSEILRLDRVVRTFLDFTRPVELKVTKVPLQVLVQEIADLASPQAAAANIQVEVKQDAGSAEIRVDRDLLKQAVLNVVVNAMQAMPDGGSLTIDSSAREMAEIRITDTGCGIPPELRERIFRLYFSTKQNGSGIGLAMTFRIVQLLDGTIDFTSEPGKGTTFLIRLPIAV